MKNQNFYVNIPASILHAANLSEFQKLLYAQIVVMTNKHGYCYAGNSYFSKLCGKSVGWISTTISDMAKKGFLRIEIEKSNGNKRKIFISTPKEKLDSYTRKVKDPIQEKPEHNNTRGIILNTNVFNKNNSIVLYKEKTLLESKIEEFEKYRREIKKPLCPISKVAMLKKLALFDEETAICMLDTSIMNGWQGVFPLRIEKGKNRDVMQNMASFNIT